MWTYCYVALSIDLRPSAPINVFSPLFIVKKVPRHNWLLREPHQPHLLSSNQKSCVCFMPIYFPLFSLVTMSKLNTGVSLNTDFILERKLVLTKRFAGTSNKTRCRCQRCPSYRGYSPTLRHNSCSNGSSKASVLLLNAKIKLKTLWQVVTKTYCTLCHDPTRSDWHWNIHRSNGPINSLQGSNSSRDRSHCWWLNSRCCSLSRSIVLWSSYSGQRL